MYQALFSPLPQEPGNEVTLALEDGTTAVAGVAVAVELPVVTLTVF